MHLHIALDQMQTDSASGLRLPVAFGLVEAGEDAGLLGRIDAAPRVAHGNGSAFLPVAGHAFHADRHASAGRGELESIGQEVVHHFVDFVLVVVHIKVVHAAFERKFKPPGFRQIAERFHGVADKAHEIAHRQRKLLALHLQFSEIQQLVDQPEQLLRVLVDDAQTLFQVGIVLLPDERTEGRENQCERRAELVTDVREEAQLHFVQMLLLLAGRLPALFAQFLLLAADVEAEHPVYQKATART